MADNKITIRARKFITNRLLNRRQMVSVALAFGALFSLFGFKRGARNHCGVCTALGCAKK